MDGGGAMKQSDVGWTFHVEDPLVGFVVHAAPWTVRAKKYTAFKKRVRLLANLAGIPEEIPAGYRAIISLSVAWKMKPRIDLSNIQKSIEDGLFVRDRGIGEFHAVSVPHFGMERAVVNVRLERETDCVEKIRSKNRN
jgi:hypothetical protein